VHVQFGKCACKRKLVLTTSAGRGQKANPKTFAASLRGGPNGKKSARGHTDSATDPQMRRQNRGGQVRGGILEGRFWVIQGGPGGTLILRWAGEPLIEKGKVRFAVDPRCGGRLDSISRFANFRTTSNRTDCADCKV